MRALPRRCAQSGFRTERPPLPSRSLQARCGPACGWAIECPLGAIIVDPERWGDRRGPSALSPCLGGDGHAGTPGRPCLLHARAAVAGGVSAGCLHRWSDADAPPPSLSSPCRRAVTIRDPLNDICGACSNPHFCSQCVPLVTRQKAQSNSALRSPEAATRTCAASGPGSRSLLARSGPRGGDGCGRVTLRAARNRNCGGRFRISDHLYGPLTGAPALMMLRGISPSLMSRCPAAAADPPRSEARS